MRSAGYVGTAMEGEQRSLRQLLCFFPFEGCHPAQGWHPSACHGGSRVVWQDGDMMHSPSPRCSRSGSSAVSLCNICCCSANRFCPSSACWQTSSGGSGAETVWRLMLWLEHVCFGQLCYKSNCREQRCWQCLMSAGIQNEPWLEPSARASMLQSFWGVANMLSNLEKLRSEITEV